MARGVWVSRSEAEATTLYEALTRYEEEVSQAKKGSAQEASVLKMCKAIDLAKRPLAAIRSADVAKLRDHWLKNYKPATVLRRLAILSHVFNVARKEWGMESLSNPVELVRKPQPNNARKRRIASSDEPALDLPDGGDPGSERGAQDDELERVIAASSSTLLPAIIWLAVETAMRRGEIVSLQWDNVDLKRRVAHLPATKNGDARDVPLSSRAVTVLQALKEDLGEVEVAPKDAPTYDALGGRTTSVFKIRSDAVTRAFERAVAVKRISAAGFHVIVNETIDVSDGGVSGVLEGGIMEFAPDDTPRCVEKPGVASLPRRQAIELLTLVYGLPDAIIADVLDTFNYLRERLGPVRFEWVHDGGKVWIVQLHRGATQSTEGVLVPGEAQVWNRFYVSTGLNALRNALETLSENEGIVLVGEIGLTSHIADVVRKAGKPARNVVLEDSVA